MSELALIQIPANEFYALKSDVQEMKALLISLQPKNKEPHPEERCSVYWIAERCDVGVKHIKNRINEMGIPKLHDKPVVIAYKYVKQLELKGFDFNK